VSITGYLNLLTDIRELVHCKKQARSAALYHGAIRIFLIQK